ncbi:DNA-3-methyladenine glycosylase [Enterococcus raffinosus]|uniref:Putative 3-methyladenine DNA glycosylase n=1 Tax=Enterococcus raffinosus TaxID=71452 RepID=A0AAW8T386_9ENTE|nr:DNA-3-methyladenine glycosylase [Enterococcus raffinosus]MDT2521933.1 DNA-3-methyladenine glycosylase [Enterococcus raffinosus]MDT2528278.1 DNA-3-methyladenine glycosylase [Enterococcus raffinosus]MDT2533257.1 DNA-3-methyladenine glycosylase [Enterococcus raffinosus]MDT2543698.1 DNA-3-methyladenine glycosylase [Enterococcus raffinosus]MDT2553811.1 DNA-3-methyladenine glycosylase [Enterococcus raffinosus]
MEQLINYFNTESTENIAQYLLGMYLEHETPAGNLAGYIVDCEAYLGPDDEAAHSYGMRDTPRVRAMYEKPGTIYLYTMHTHLILNMITQPVGMPQGVMIRGIEPAEGIEQMISNRHGRRGSAISDGPGKLVEALGITKELYGKSIFTSPLHLLPEKRRIPKQIDALPRIGIPNKGIWTERPLRYVVHGNPYITNQRKASIEENNGWRK